MSAEHSEGHHEIDVDKHVRVYLIVFASLAALTIITVGISYLHLSVVPAVTLALLVATIKGSLVACYFMHLISERKLIYLVLAFTAFFFICVLLVPMMTNIDRPGLGF
jgi:cytochrome c oxidase subunit IV